MVPPTRRFLWSCLASLALTVVALAVALGEPQSTLAATPCDEWIYSFPSKDFVGESIPYPVPLTVGETVTLEASSCDGTYCRAIDDDELPIAFIEVGQDPESPLPGQPVINVPATGPPLTIRTFRFVVPKLDRGPHWAEMKCDGWIGFADVVVSAGPPDTATESGTTGLDASVRAFLLLLVFGGSSQVVSIWLSRRSSDTPA